MTTLRLAAAQLHYHPAFEGGGKVSLREPTGAWEGAGISGLRAGTEEGDRLLDELRERVERVYVEVYRPRLEAVVRFCGDLEIDLLVLPEYSVPAALLPAVAEAAGERMTVVAGTHTVTRKGVKGGDAYRRVGIEVASADVGRAIAPVLRGGKAIAVQAKLARSRFEPDLKAGERWAAVPIGEGGAASVGILVCIDFLKRSEGEIAERVARELDACAVVAVPSLTPFASLEHFERNAEEILFGYDRPVVYANRAAEGGTRVFTEEEAAPVVLAAGRAPVLALGVEGVVAVEVRFGEGKQRYRLAAASRPLAAAVLMDAGRHGELRRAAEEVLLAGDAGEGLDRIEAAREVFERAAGNRELPEIARERWRYLAEGAEGTTSVEHLRALVRDVWVEGVRGGREVERGLVEGAVKVLREVEKKAPEAQRVVVVRGWLEGEVLKRFEGVGSAGEVVEGVTEGMLSEAVRAVAEVEPPREDGSFDRWVKDPGPFPVRLLRQGFLPLEEIQRTRDVQGDEAVIFRPFVSGATKWGVRVVPRDQAAGLLALWGHPPAWFATAPEKGLCFVLNDCRTVIYSNVPMNEHRDEREPYVDGLPRALFNDYSAKLLGNHPGFKIIEDEIARLGRREDHLRSVVAYFGSEEGRRFVEPVARLRGGSVDSTSNHLDAWLSGPSSLCLLLAEFGVGKSTVSRQFAARLGQAALDDDARPVILVDLRAWSGPVNLVGLVRRALEMKATENVASARFAIEEGGCVLILDGFDEMSNRLTPAELSNALRALLAWRTDRSKILLTCRTHLFIDPADLDRIFTEATGAPLKTPGLGEIEGVTVLELQLFDKERIQSYLARVSPDPKRAWEAMGEVHDLRNLAERPLLLDMIRQSLPLLTRAESVTLGDLYETYVQRWAAWPGPEEWLDPKQKIAFAEELAFCIWNGGPEVKEGAIRVDRLAAVLFQGQSIDWIRRLDNDAVRLELRAGTFLVWQDGEDAGYYRFAHRSFLEYMLARRTVRRLGGGDGGALDLARLSPEVIAYCRARPGWEEARRGAIAALVEAYRKRISENALLLVAGVEGSASSAEAPFRLEGAELQQASLRGAKLAGVRLEKAELEGAALAGADLRGARLEGARLDRADLTRADLGGAATRRARLEGAALDGAVFEGADLREVWLDGSSALAQAPVLREARLEGASVTGTVWREPARSLELCGLAGVEAARWRRGEAIEHASEMREASCVELGRHRGDVNGLAFSPDGKRVATACDDRVLRIWEASTGRLLQTLQGHTSILTSVAWTADGERLATGSYDQTARVCDASTGRLLQTLQGHTSHVMSVAWTADGERLATGSYDTTARVWEASTGRLLQTLQGHTSYVTSVAWTADGERLATGSYDKTARVWEASTGRLLQTLQAHTSYVMSVAWTADDERLATGSHDKTARVWEASTGRLLQTLQGHTSDVTSVTWTADGERLATGSYDKTARVWEASTGRLLQTLQGHTNWVSSVAWTADGERLATGSYDETARVWEASTGRLLQTLQGHSETVTSVAWTADGERLATGSSDDETARVWEASTGRLLQTLQGHASIVTSVAWTADGERLATGSYDKTARVWEASTGRLLQTLQGHSEAVTSVAWTADGKRLATGSSDETARVWEASTGRLLQTLQGHTSTVTSVAWTVDGERLATGSSDETARVWEASTGRLLQTLQGHTSTVTSVAWTADGERLATGSYDDTARVWEASTGRLLQTLQGHSETVTSVAWTADGERLATGSDDRTARVWEASTGRLLQTLQGRTDRVTSVAWTADGKRLAMGSYDNTTHLWDVEPPRELAVLLPTPAGAITLSGSYASPTGDVDLSAFVVRTGSACAPLSLYADICIRPDLVGQALSGHPAPSLHIPMDTAALSVAAAAQEALVPRDLLLPLPPIKAGTPTTLPAFWTIASDLLRQRGFRVTLKALLPAGPLDLALEPARPDFSSPFPSLSPSPSPSQFQSPTQTHSTFSLPALPPGTHQLLLTLHLGTRHERAFTAPLTVLPHNPYIAGPSVRGADLVGRDADLARIRALLQHGSIRLAGERRIGKTSILHHFFDSPPSAFAPIWLNAEEKHDTAFRDWVFSAVRHHLSNAPSTPSDLLPFLRALAATTLRPLFLLDEIVHLRALSASDAALLRSLTSPPFAAILAGSPYDWSRFFAALPDEAGSPFNHLQDLTLGPLTDVETTRLVTRPGAPPPDADALRRLLDLAGGRPYLAQRLCQAALDRVYREERMTVTLADVDAVAREALVKGLDHQHRKRWTELAAAPAAQRAISAHARTGALPPAAIHDLLAEHGLFDGDAWTVDPAFVLWLKDHPEGP